MVHPLLCRQWGGMRAEAKGHTRHQIRVLEASPQQRCGDEEQILVEKKAAGTQREGSTLKIELTAPSEVFFSHSVCLGAGEGALSLLSTFSFHLAPYLPSP